MNNVQVDLGDWIKSGFEMYKENFSILLLASLIALALTLVTVGVLAGPMYAGIVLITIRIYDKKEPKPVTGDVFKGFNFFLNSFLFFLVWGILILVASTILSLVPCIGQIAVICLSLAAGAFLMFGLFLIVDKPMDFWPASLESINTVKNNFWPFLGLSVVAGVIGSIGSIACGVGIIFTSPIYFCILTVAYRNVFVNSSAPTDVENVQSDNKSRDGETAQPT
jgi:uncharacterized membrane protein